MKKINSICQIANMPSSKLKVLITLAHLLIGTSVHSQTVIASAGGYQSNAAGSLSFTIGETNTQTLSSATHMLTQGFQQPYELNLLNVKAFLQGYYIGAGQMQDVLYNQGEYVNPTLVTDTITVEFHSSTPPHALTFLTKTTIKQDGTISIKGLGVVGQSYYIVLKHRNSVETWSANPVLISANTNYDFSTAASQAFGGNQSEVESGVWALFSGDINQDENIDLLDASFLEVDINNFEFGYFATDINGDGNVDLLDAPIVESNINNFVFAIHP